MYRDTSSVDCAPRELTHACSINYEIGKSVKRKHDFTWVLRIEIKTSYNY